MTTDLWHWLADPWSGEIMRRALAEVVLLGIAGGAIGCWVVLNQLSYGAESLPHAMFPGLVLATLGGVSLLAGGAGGLPVAALAVGGAGRAARVAGGTSPAAAGTTPVRPGDLRGPCPPPP